MAVRPTICLKGLAHGIDRVDAKLADCIELAEETLRAGSLISSKETNPQLDQAGDIFPKTNSDGLADTISKEIIPEILDPTLELRFANFLEELETPDDLDKWLDDIDLFMEGFHNPDKIEELWQQSKDKKL